MTHQPDEHDSSPQRLPKPETPTASDRSSHSVDASSPSSANTAPRPSSDEVKMSRSPLTSELLPAANSDAEATAEQSQQASFQDWVTEHYASVYRYAFRLAGDAVAAEDVTQQAFLQAWSHRQQVAQAQAVRGWLMTITRNTYLKSLRRERPSSFTNLGLDGEGLERVSCPETTTDVRDLLEQLGDEQRVIVLMFYFEGLSYREISEQLALPIGTVMSRLHRAKTSLRSLIENQGSES